MKVLVTGGAGFIGSAVVRYLLSETAHSAVVLDKLTYAGNLSNLEAVAESERYEFVLGDVCDTTLIQETLERIQPDAIMHLAAESHVDRSIDGPGAFIQTNILGTYTLLEAAKNYYSRLAPERKSSFRFHHISTDEVYGSLGATGLFDEQHRYAPNSPYSASKAASDHLVRAWGATFGLPIIVTNCSNNYGPFHFPEKLIPLVIQNALLGKPLPVYGKGNQVRDWLYVEDHARALVLVVEKGKVGETYNIGGHNEKENIQVVMLICDLMDKLYPNKPEGITTYKELITHVPDRPGHDLRYAIDASKIERELGWKPLETFESGLEKTVRWFLNNQSWVEHVQTDVYRGERLGLR